VSVLIMRRVLFAGGTHFTANEMPPSRADEEDFMRSLLSDLDSASSLPPPPPLKSRSAGTSTPQARIRSKAVNGVPTTAHRDSNDTTALLEGAEDWDWSDMLSPVKASSSTPQKSRTVAQAQERHGSKADKDTLPTIQLTSAATSRDGADIAMLLDGAEDWDWGDMLTPTKGTPSPKKPKLSPGQGSPSKPPPHVSQREFRGPTCTRCIVESISLSSVGRSSQKVRALNINSTGSIILTPPPLKILVVRTETGNERRSVVLQDDWIMTDVRNGNSCVVIPWIFNTLKTTL
jgi:hypothetical protein